MRISHIQSIQTPFRYLASRKKSGTYNKKERRRDYSFITMKYRAMDLVMQELKQNTFLKEKDKLLGFIRSRVSSTEEAEDILQDVFYQFVTGFETIESLDRVTSWLYSVARNKIIDRY